MLFTVAYSTLQLLSVEDEETRRLKSILNVLFVS